MFRTFSSSFLSFLAILLFALMTLFLWKGSEEMQFSRKTLEGDKSTLQVLEDFRRQQMKAAELADNERKQEMDKPAEDTPAANEGSGGGPAVVLWISIPGFRGDYVDKSEVTFFKKLTEEGSASSKMRPNFPCMTYPAHATMATGVTPDKHGIIADRIRTASGEVIDSPTDPALLLAEPIWITATRQGVKTLVHDWPLSQNQSGDTKAAHFLTSFDPEMGDEARLNRALEEWRADSAAGGDKLRLVMLRLDDILRHGLLHGPRASETYAAVSATDKALQTFVETIQKEWATLATPDSNLILFITTDHGLAELDKNVNVVQLLGEEMMKNCDIISHDAIANLFFKGLPESDGEKQVFLAKFDNELGKRIYFRTIKKEELPAEWGYLNPERTGDRVLVLKTGYSFVDQTGDEPIFEPSVGSKFFGGYGYPVEESVRMSGQIFLAGFPKAIPTDNLDVATQVTFHATVCKLLGIQPAEGATADTLPLK